MALVYRPATPEAQRVAVAEVVIGGEQDEPRPLRSLCFTVASEARTCSNTHSGLRPGSRMKSTTNSSPSSRNAPRIDASIGAGWSK